LKNGNVVRKKNSSGRKPLKRNVFERCSAKWRLVRLEKLVKQKKQDRGSLSAKWPRGKQDSRRCEPRLRPVKKKKDVSRQNERLSNVR